MVEVEEEDDDGDAGRLLSILFSELAIRLKSARYMLVLDRSAYFRLP